MQPYRDLWISGRATPGYPAGNHSTPGATVLYQRPDSSVLELTTLNVHNVELENREAAELPSLRRTRKTGLFELSRLGLDRSRRPAPEPGRRRAARDKAKAGEAALN